MLRTKTTRAAVPQLGLALVALLLCCPPAVAQPEDLATPRPTLVQQIKAGDASYSEHCAACHQYSGSGLPNLFPPLAASDYLKQSKLRAIDAVLFGVNGPIRVNGEDFNGCMPPLARLEDGVIANILTFLLNVWMESGEAVSAEEVTTAREHKPGDRPPCLAKDPQQQYARQ